MVESHELLKCSKETGRENVGLYKIPVSDKQGGCAYEVTVTSEPQHRVRAYIDMKGRYRKYGPVSFSTVPGGVGEVFVLMRFVTRGGL